MAKLTKEDKQEIRDVFENLNEMAPEIVEAIRPLFNKYFSLIFDSEAIQEFRREHQKLEITKALLRSGIHYVNVGNSVNNVIKQLEEIK